MDLRALLALYDGIKLKASNSYSTLSIGSPYSLLLFLLPSIDHYGLLMLTLIKITTSIQASLSRLGSSVPGWYSLYRQ